LFFVKFDLHEVMLSAVTCLCYRSVLTVCWTQRHLLWTQSNFRSTSIWTTHREVWPITLVIKGDTNVFEHDNMTPVFNDMTLLLRSFTYRSS